MLRDSGPPPATDVDADRSGAAAAGSRPPDRHALDPASPFHDAAAQARGIGVRFNGLARERVVEYCVSEGWIRISLARDLQAPATASTLRLEGEVEPWFRDDAGR